MRRIVLIPLAALLLAACGSSAKQAIRSDAAEVTTTTTSGAEQPGGGPAVEPTTTTTAAPLGVAPTTSTSAPRGATTTTRPRTAATVATTSTTRALVAQEATTSTTVAPQATTTTTGAPGTTTTSTTTKPLEKVSALTIKGACQPPSQYGDIPKSFTEGIDPPRLKADLATRGYDMPANFQFRSSNGQPVQPTLERNMDDARQQWKNCFDAAGGKKLVVTINTVAGEAGSAAFAQLVKAEMDEIPNMAPYGSYTVA